MAQGLEFDLKQLVLSNRSFGPVEIEQIVRAISEDFANYRLLRDAVAELEAREDHTPASAVRLGVCFYLLGRYRRTIETLRGADGGALAQMYMGKSHFSLQEYKDADKCYQAAKTAGYDGDACVLGENLVRHALARAAFVGLHRLSQLDRNPGIPLGSQKFHLSSQFSLDTGAFARYSIP